LRGLFDDRRDDVFAVRQGFGLELPGESSNSAARRLQLNVECQLILIRRNLPPQAGAIFYAVARQRAVELRLKLRAIGLTLGSTEPRRRARKLVQVGDIFLLI